MGRRITLLTDLALTIATGLQSHLVPVDTTGGLDLSGWKSGAYSPDACMFRLEPSVGGAVAIAAGAHVIGNIGLVLYKVADINRGEAFALTETLGFGVRLIDIGVFEKLWLVDVGSANTHKYGATPIESLG